MAELRLLVGGPDGPIDPATAHALRQDLDQEAGATVFAPAPREAGGKGLDVAQAGALIVQILGTQALISLVAVLKSYVDRNRVTDIEVTGPRGTAKLTLPEGSRLSADDIRRTLSDVFDAEDGE